jgi:hypothetical protein
MSEAALLKGDKGKIKIEIFGYEYPIATDVDDSNWLQARLEVSAGPFTGSVEISITAAELAMLCRELTGVTKALTGNVRFETMEGNWTLYLDFQRTGTAVVSGVITPCQAQDNSLHYEFRTDPITLEGLVRDLSRMATIFPVKK